MRSELGIRAERVRLSGQRSRKAIVNPAKWPEREDQSSSLVLLERLGIVECHQVEKNNLNWPSYTDLEQLRLDAALLPPELGGGPGGYFHRHSFQTSSLFYRLADWLELSECNRFFNPFLPRIESDLKQARSNLSQTSNGQSSPTQASPGSDSSLHVDSWSGKDGYEQLNHGLIEVASSKDDCAQLKDECSLQDALLPQAQPLYQLLRQAHQSLTGYNGSGMSEAKANELANRWVARHLPVEEASLIVQQLISDWNNAQSNIYSPIGLLIKRLEAALSQPSSRTANKRLQPTPAQTFSYNEATRPAFRKGLS